MFVFVLTIALTSFYFLKRYREGSQYAVTFYVYSQEVENPVDLYLRNIPEQYSRLFTAERVKPFQADVAVYKVHSNLSGEKPDIHYLVHDRMRNDTRFLKSRFLLAEKPVSVDETEVDSYMIDYDQFSRYVTHWSTTEEIVTEYAGMLRDDSDPSTFRRIRSMTDIDTIRRYHQKAFYRCSQPVIPGRKIVDELADNEFMFWYFDKGFVKFTANTANGKIISIASKRLGFGTSMTGM